MFPGCQDVAPPLPLVGRGWGWGATDRANGGSVNHAGSSGSTFPADRGALAFRPPPPAPPHEGEGRSPS